MAPSLRRVKPGRRGNADLVAPTLRAQRLRWAWVLAVPFLFLSRPTPSCLTLGVLLAVPGLLLRGVSAGFIHKDRVLARHGPYAYLRHPLYLGSFLAGSGLAVASGHPALMGIFLILFFWVYLRTIRAEERELEARFGEAYRFYRSRVPAVLPRPSTMGGRCPEPAGTGGIRTFQTRAFIRNRGWEAPLGVLAGFLLLWLRMRV